jgi:hypothetical protein
VPEALLGAGEITDPRTDRLQLRRLVDTLANPVCSVIETACGLASASRLHALHLAGSLQELPFLVGGLDDAIFQSDYAFGLTVRLVAIGHFVGVIAVIVDTLPVSSLELMVKQRWAATPSISYGFVQVHLVRLIVNEWSAAPSTASVC